MSNIKGGSFLLFIIKKLINGQMETSHWNHVGLEPSCCGPCGSQDRPVDCRAPSPDQTDPALN